MQRRILIRLALFGALAAGLTGCASSLPKGVGVAPESERAATRFAWHDLVALDVEASRTFYTQLFGWAFLPSGVTGYDWIVFDNRVIGGLVDAAKLPRAPRSAVWLTGVTVDDLADATARVKDAGGAVLREPLTLPRRGGLAVVTDPDGALLQLVADNPHAHVRSNPPVGGWLWTELIANDPAGAADFYRTVLGFDAVPEREQYTLLTEGDAPQAGIVPNPFEDTAATWVPFVRVADPSVTAQRAIDLGGRVVLPPGQDFRGGSVSLILDPGGAPLALQKWDGPAGAQEVVR